MCQKVWFLMCENFIDTKKHEINDISQPKKAKKLSYKISIWNNKNSFPFPLFLTSRGSVWRYVTRHCRFNNQPWIPSRVRQQPGLYVVNPCWARGHHSSRLQWLLIRGQIWLPGNQWDRSTKHMVRHISHTDCNAEPDNTGVFVQISMTEAPCVER